MAGNRTRVNCLEGSYAHHYTTIASMMKGRNIRAMKRMLMIRLSI